MQVLEPILNYINDYFFPDWECSKLTNLAKASELLETHYHRRGVCFYHRTKEEFSHQTALVGVSFCMNQFTVLESMEIGFLKPAATSHGAGFLFAHRLNSCNPPLAIWHHPLKKWTKIPPISSGGGGDSWKRHVWHYGNSQPACCLNRSMVMIDARDFHKYPQCVCKWCRRKRLKTTQTLLKKQGGLADQAFLLQRTGVWFLTNWWVVILW